MKLDEVLSFTADGSYDLVDRIIQGAPLDYIETTAELIEYINSELKKAKVKVEFDIINHPPVRINWGRVGIYGGAYDPNTKIIRMHVLPTFLRWVKQIPDEVMQVIHKIFVHEKVHSEQHRRSMAFNGKKPIDMFAPRGDTRQDYISHPQEIGAMAAEIIADLHSQGLSNEEIKQAIIKNDVATLVDSERFLDYIHYKPSKKVMHKLYKTLITMLS
jgi:hypothetical protein